MASTEEMTSSSEQVVNEVNSMAGLAEGSAATTEEISASTEELTASSEQVATYAKKLSLMSEELKAIISSFRMSRYEGKRCWEIKKCSDQVHSKCPTYKSEEDRCWLVEGTWCGGVQQGDALAKRKNCMNCMAFEIISGTSKTKS